MNERVTIAAIVLLLAAGGLMQALSPAVQALVGSYASVLRTAEGDARCVLTLSADASATFQRTASDGRSAPATTTGSWIADGGTIQLVLRDPADPSKPVAVTLEPSDGTLVVRDVEGRASPYVGLTFVRTDSIPPASK